MVYISKETSIWSHFIWFLIYLPLIFILFNMHTYYLFDFKAYASTRCARMHTGVMKEVSVKCVGEVLCGSLLLRAGRATFLSAVKLHCTHHTMIVKEARRFPCTLEISLMSPVKPTWTPRWQKRIRVMLQSGRAARIATHCSWWHRWPEVWTAGLEARSHRGFSWPSLHLILIDYKSRSLSSQKHKIKVLWRAFLLS